MLRFVPSRSISSLSALAGRTHPQDPSSASEWRPPIGYWRRQRRHHDQNLSGSATLSKMQTPSSRCPYSTRLQSVALQPVIPNLVSRCAPVQSMTSSMPPSLDTPLPSIQSMLSLSSKEFEVSTPLRQRLNGCDTNRSDPPSSAAALRECDFAFSTTGSPPCFVGRTNTEALHNMTLSSAHRAGYGLLSGNRQRDLIPPDVQIASRSGVKRQRSANAIASARSRKRRKEKEQNKSARIGELEWQLKETTDERDRLKEQLTHLRRRSGLLPKAPHS